MLREYKGKAVYKWHSANDINGNKIGKIFYVDGSTEIVRGSNIYSLPMISDKHYKSLSGLYASK